MDSPEKWHLFSFAKLFISQLAKSGTCYHVIIGKGGATCYYMTDCSCLRWIQQPAHGVAHDAHWQPKLRDPSKELRAAPNTAAKHKSLSRVAGKAVWEYIGI